MSKVLRSPNAPTRQVGRRGTFKPSNLVRLRKHDKPIHMESSLEVFVAKIADLSNASLQIYSQPFTVDVLNKKILGNAGQLELHRTVLKQLGMPSSLYTPDISVQWSSSKGKVTEVMEIKDSNWIPSLGDDYTAKLLETRSMLAQQGITFGLYEARVKDLYGWALSANINRLHALALRRYDMYKTLSEDYSQYLTHKNALLQCVHENAGITLQRLAEQCEVQQSVTWHLLIDELVSADLWCTPLGPMTSVVGVKDCPSELGLFRRILLALTNKSWEVLCDQ